MLMPLVCSQRVCLLHATERIADPPGQAQLPLMALDFIWGSSGQRDCSPDSKSGGAVRRAVSSTPADPGDAPHGCCFCHEAHLAQCIHALSCSAGGSGTAGTEVAPVSWHTAAVPLGPLATVALNWDFCPTFSINLLPTPLPLHPSELLAKPLGLPWSVSVLPRASLQRIGIFPGMVFKTVKPVPL